MPIGTGIIYNVGDLILSQVSGSGTAFLETKIAAATSSIVYFDNTARINSASLNSITVGTASYVSGSTSIITNLTASNISASGTSSFGMVGIGTSSPTQKLHVAGDALIASSATAGNLYFGDTSIYVRRDNSYDLSLVQAADSNSALYLVSAGSVYLNIDSNNNDTDKAFIVQNNALKAGTELFRVSETGNVGIGTSIPSQKLHIKSTDTFAAIKFTNSVSDAGIISYSSDNLYFYTANAQRITIDTAGNVGIGTTTPTARLHVSGSTDGIFEVDTAGGVTSLYVSASGNVGIGTSNPIAILNVKTSTTANREVFMGDSSAVAGVFRARLDDNSLSFISIENRDINTVTDHGVGIRFNLGTNASSNAINAGGIYLGKEQTWTATASTQDSYLIFNTSLDGTASEKVRVTSAGNVGIGTPSPSTPLHVFNTAATLATFTRDLATDVGFSIGADTNGTVFSTAGAHAYQFYTNGTEKVRIISDGNVGIGTTSPASKLHISGSGQTIMRLDSDTTSSVSQFQIKAASDAVLIMGMFGGSATGNNYGVTAAGQAYFGTTTLGSPHPTSLVIGNASTIPIVFSTANTEKMRIDSSGNILIGGTSTTNSPIEFQQDGDALIKRLFVTTTTGSAYAYINSQDGYESWIQFGGQTNYNNGIIKYSDASNFMSFWTNTTEKVRIDTAGNVGIGTTAPGALLEISSSTAASLLNVKGAGGNGILFVSGSGNVGIGTTNPSAKLTVVQSAGADSVLLDLQSNNDPGIRFGRSSYGSLIRHISATTDYIAFNCNGTSQPSVAATAQVVFDENGNVGIGTSSPVAKLQVAGNISGSSFTSSISNAVGFLGTSSWAQNVVSASFATTAQTANALNTGNSYTISGLTNNSTLSQQGTLSMGSGYQILATTGTAPIPGISFVGDTNTGIYAPSADTIGFSISGSEKVRIANDGNVGIGTTNPLKNLQINAVTASIRLEESSAGSKRLEFSIDSSAVAKISANQSGQSIAFETVGSERIRIVADGNVGIGITNPSYNLSISGSAGLQGNEEYLYFHSNYSVGNNARGKIRVVGAGGGSGYGGDLRFSTRKPTNVWNEDALTIDSSGNVGIGTSSPAVNLEVVGASETLGTIRISGGKVNVLAVGEINSALEFAQRDASIAGLVAGKIASISEFSNGAYAGLGFYTAQQSRVPELKEAVRITNNGDVGIGTTAPAAKLEISGSSNSVLLNIKSAISGAILYVSGSGAVGIGTSNVGAYTLQVSGSFAATTKSFVIEHPTKAGKKLIYGSLESPYHGIRLTGRDTLVNGKCKIQLPDYIYKLILHDSVNIQLTGIKCNKTLYVDEINIPENYFTIAYDKAIFESYKDYDFFWDFTGIRTDVPELITEL